jgi:hypothetical protein
MIDAIEAVNGTSGIEPTLPVPHPSATGNSGTGNDGVTLSETAQVSLMQQEGMSVSEIATELDLTTAVVSSDLGIAAAITHPLGSTAQPDQGGATGTVSQP